MVAAIAAIGISERDVGNRISADCCELVRTTRSTVRDWRKRGVGSRVTSLQGVSQFYVTVVQARPFLLPTTVPSAGIHCDG